MDPTQIDAFYPLTVATRALFHKLGAAVTALHEDTGISGGMRAVLESLTYRGPQTVPQMARARPVSRQHIQALVNNLLARGHVEYLDNPAHRRSKLVQATEAGRRAFLALRRRENQAFARLDLGITADDLRSAGRVLSDLITVFEGAEWRALVDDLRGTETEDSND